MKISSRALLDFLAGRINQEQFQHFTSLSDGENLFEKWLKNGWSLSDVSFESGGLDEDDDYIVFSGKQDPGADKFQ